MRFLSTCTLILLSTTLVAAATAGPLRVRIAKDGGVSWGKNCWRHVVCVGDAIRWADAGQ